MKVCFKNFNKTLSPEQIKVVKKFVKFIQNELPLKKDINITFTKHKDVPMTTGVRFPNSEIFVLSGGRLLIDILRTLGHEWVHEFQHQKMGLKDTDKIQDIGGPEENMANVLAGIFTKKFEKQFSNDSKLLYGEGN